MAKSLDKQVSEAAAKQHAEEPVEVLDRRNLLSSGSTLLNLALTGNPFGGFLKGYYYFMVGDSASGKTIQAMTVYAEASINRHFKGYRFIYDNIEHGMLMDTDSLFSMEMTDRIEPPSRDKTKKPRFSRTLDEFYYHVDDAANAGVPFIYILDSMDALNPEADEKKFDQLKKAHEKSRRKEDGEDSGDEKEEKTTGSYGMAKAKLNSVNLRKVQRRIHETGSILIILSQTRDNVGAQYGGKTRGGGHALRFYATCEFWTSIVETLKKSVRGKARKVGVRVKYSMKKNRHTGKLYDVESDIYPSYGIDDIGACIDYLLEEKWWTKEKESIKATEFGLTAGREALIRTIETNGQTNELRAIVGQCWKEIDDACSLKRRKKYQ